MTAASGVCWVSSRSLISDSLRPLDSRNGFFRSIEASRMESSSRNLEAFSIREALGSEDSCSAGSCGGVLLSGCFSDVEGSWRCHEGILLGFGPSESPIIRMAIAAAVQGRAGRDGVCQAEVLFLVSALGKSLALQSTPALGPPNRPDVSTYLPTCKCNLQVEVPKSK